MLAGHGATWVMGWVLTSAAIEPSTGPGEPATPHEATATDEPTTAPTVAPVPEPPRFLEPRRIRGRDRRPSGSTTHRFTDRPPLLRPALRVAPGFSARLTGRPYAAFGLDLLGSVMFGLHGGRRQLGLAPEVGYSLRAPGLDQQLLLGMGVVHGINVEHATVGLLPRAVLQPVPSGLGVGVRTGLWFDFAENGFSAELSHQYLRLGDTAHHELRVSLSIDVLMLAIVLGDWKVAWL